MAAKVIESFMHRRNLMYHRCQDWDGSRAFFESIADWLSNIGDSMLADYISATPCLSLRMLQESSSIH